MPTTIKTHSDPVRRAALRAGASAIALGGAMLALPLAAQQVVVGSAACPIVAGVATCEGDLSGGVTSNQPQGHPPVRTINVRNTTTTIAPPNGIFGIGADRSDGDLTINVADGVTIDVFDNLAIVEPAQGIVALLRGGNSLVIDSGATITSNGGGSRRGRAGARGSRVMRSAQAATSPSPIAARSSPTARSIARSRSRRSFSPAPTARSRSPTAAR